MVEEYTASVYGALFRDLSDVQTKRIVSYLNGKAEYADDMRRPYHSEIDIYSFPQQWSSTALGFGGIGGQAFTTALTVVVICGREACVYFGGRFAYKIQKFNSKLLEDVANFAMCEVGKQRSYSNG